MTRTRWDWLEGLKPESAVTVGVRQVARMIADDLSDWPPSVTLGEGPAAGRFADLLGSDAQRPPLVAFQEAIKRATWELERDFDAIDHYERNHKLEEACPRAHDRLASEFMQHYILESFFMLMERTDNRVKRKDVLVGIELLSGHVAARWNAN